MEPEFDKEIDALMRKETAGRTITISEFAGGLHLDADEITAFAEKRVPPNVRGAFIEHFAACDRCRKVLLNATWLNAEEASEEEAAVAAPAVAAVPWYRRLFLFPNLAYVMGGLIVLFGGFIGLSVYTGLTRNATVATRSDPTEPALESAPVRPGVMANANTAANAAVTSNTTSTAASNTMANVSAGDSRVETDEELIVAPTPEPRATAAPRMDDLARSTQPAMAPPAAAAPVTRPKDDASTADTVVTQRKAEDLPVSARSVARERDSRNEAKKMAESEIVSGSGRTFKMEPPAKSDKQNSRSVGEDPKLKRAANSGAGGARKQVQGRTFEFRQGAWYDLTYRGGGTTNVRRNSSEYYKLDVGLRGIAESFIGTVITVWNGRAYKIN